MARPRELGRGERVLPGLWRLRLPLPWPGVPHCNAWAIAAGAGVVLIDTGMHEPGSLAQLERAMDQVNLRLEHVRLLACTHAHSDHWGQAAPIRDRAGCEFWMHPDHAHAGARRRPIGSARWPVVSRWRARAASRGDARGATPSRSRTCPRASRNAIEPDRELVPGVEIETDLGVWTRPRDARACARPRLPVPGRSPGAHLRRSPARPHLAVLRLRPHPRSGGRVPGLAGPRVAARRAARALGPRQALPRRSRPHRGQPRARRRAARGDARRRWAPSPGPAVEIAPAVLASRRRLHQRPLGADPDALLPRPTSSDRARPRRASQRRRD